MKQQKESDSPKDLKEKVVEVKQKKVTIEESKEEQKLNVEQENRPKRTL